MAAAQRLQIVLEALELTRRGDRARIQLGIDLGRFGLDGGDFVLDPLLLAADGVAFNLHRTGLGVERRHLLALAGEVGALGQRVTPVPELIEVGVVGLHLQQLLEDRHQWSLSHAKALSTKTRGYTARDHPGRWGPRTVAKRAAPPSEVASKRAAIRSLVWWSWCSCYRYLMIVVGCWPTAMNRNAIR